MYRLSRFFISDVAAGENIVQNGYFPICREGERADHGVLFAQNGSCKTTLLSFLLSAFCPEQRRFVQHLQSGGDKSLDQYLIPGRPAVVLINLTVTAEPTLFEAEPEEHLLVGQLIYRHKGAAGKIDRIYFTSSEESLFDELRFAWPGLSAEEKPFTAAREYITPRVTSTTSQRDWEEHLEKLDLDPWLVNRQVDFARSEGGIKDAFKFRNEEEFMGFFLGCVTDLDVAAKLRETTLQSMEKMRHRPEKKARLKAAWGLREKLSEFEAVSGKWRSAGDDTDAFRLRLGEARRLLSTAKAAAAARGKEVAVKIHEAAESHDAVTLQLNRTRANAFYLESVKYAREEKRLKEQVDAATEAYASGRREQASLRGAGLAAKIRRLSAQIDDREKALSDKDDALAPVREQISVRSSQYHHRLASERDEAAKERHRLKEEQQAAGSRRRTIEAEAEALASDVEKARHTITRCTTLIDAAETSRTALALAQDQSPEEALEDLKTEQSQHASRREEIIASLEDLYLEMEESKQLWKRSQREQVEAESAAKKAAEALDKEKAARESLQANRHLAAVAGCSDLSPHRPDLASRVAEMLQRKRNAVAEQNHRRFTLDDDIERLSTTETLAVDADTRRLLAWLQEEGVSPADVKAFPDYLAVEYGDPQVVARFLEKDPGRFTGIMAKNDKVLEKVKALSTPDWLTRPVVISVPSALEEVADCQGHVLAPADASVYSPSFIETRITELKARRAALVETLVSEQALLAEMEHAARLLTAYLEQYPDESGLQALEGQLTEAGHRVEEIQAEIARAEEAQRVLLSEENRLKGEAKGITEKEGELTRRMQQITAWQTQYGELEAWKQSLNDENRNLSSFEGRKTEIRESREALGDEMTRLVELLARNEASVKRLDEKAELVPQGDATLDEDQKQEAREMDLSALASLYAEALERERRVAGELGIESLAAELTELKAKRQKEAAELERSRREYDLDEALVETWASHTDAERAERMEALAAMLEETLEQKGAFVGKQEGIVREKQRLDLELGRWKGRGVTPDVSADTLETDALDEAMEGCSLEGARLREELMDLETRQTKLKSKADMVKTWSTSLDLGTARIKDYTPVWDEESPRREWPELVECANPVVAAEVFLKEVEEVIRLEADSVAESVRQHRVMSAAFDRLQVSLSDEKLKEALPAVVDELRRHDAETLGAQSAAMVATCKDLAENIESDLARSEKFVGSLIGMMLQHVKECHQKLLTATRITMPDDVFIYGGKAILRCSRRLDFARHEEAFRESIDNWLHELIEANRMPEVNARTGNMLGAELMYRLLQAATGKSEFAVRLLKCDDTGRRYEQVGKDLGSGGEALTTAVLLYALLTSMRQKRRNRKEDRLPAFLIADNPLGVCNRSDFLDAQLKVARAMGIQCVYFTGINDTESLGLFEHRVAVRKSGKRVQIEGVDYNHLEVIEQNLERV
ncbi:hypothetical protein [Desulfoluna butyratoxydans]|uniref:Uncharacterized protein n=1 Tax=Desulfoluna butyratoxydans TaxID=231438 RepID=A0A4U8YSV3_9BACT|nr:hypothetical protein [Desulfoluna butyratoxydans]VFQ47040.1 hypothetical protein MSL71_47250 [Desulfoluna butyratoxydans]